MRPVTSNAESITTFDLAMMERAIELGRQGSLKGEIPVGAVVYRGQEIISEAHNLRETMHDPSAHAERLAITEAGQKLETWRLTDCSLAVTLEPCPMCAGLLVNARLHRLVYGATDPKAGACDTLYNIPSDKRLNHAVEVHGGVMADQCADLLRCFFLERR
jgi:tRNA(adenine34) deaminase